MRIKSQLKAGWVYTVLPGDTLSGIAKKFYKNAYLYPEIYNYKGNKATIGKDPDDLKVGTKIQLW